MGNKELSKILESLLFVLGEPAKFAKLVKITSKKDEEVRLALRELAEELAGRGIRLVVKDDEVQLVTAPENREIVERIVGEEFSGNLTKASLEALAIVIYKSPVTRPEIDYIRGVNSSFMLRSLLVRGLVERSIHPEDARKYLYRPTMELLKFLGVENLEDIPRYSEFRQSIGEFLKTHEEEKEVEEAQ